LINISEEEIFVNYERIYNQIIARAHTRKLTDYKERHHILPKSMGGSDDANNLVELTAREHFLCHWLLTKIYPTGNMHYKAVRAWAMMAWCSTDLQSRYKITSRTYQRAKRALSKVMSRSQKGKNNNRYGQKWIHNLELQKSKTIPADSILPEGWQWGRIIDWENFGPKNRICETCKNSFSPTGNAKYCSKACRPVRRSDAAARSRYYGARACIVEGKEYATISLAADAHGIGHETMRMRLRNPKFPDYVFKDGM
jgi:hypothetical protein